MNKINASDCLIFKEKDFEITKKNALKVYEEEGCAFGLFPKYIIDNFSENQIIESQNKIISNIINECNKNLEKEKSYDNLLNLVENINKLKSFYTNKNEILKSEYNMLIDMYKKYGYSIDSDIIEKEENIFNPFNSINYKPVVFWYSLKDDGLFNIGKLVKDDRVYGGILANAYKLDNKELIYKILNNLVVPSFQNNNTKPDITDKPINEIILTEKSSYIYLKEFIKDFNIDFDLDKAIYGDNKDKLMASMCFAIYQKEDYIMTKEKAKERWSLIRDDCFGVYSDKFYEFIANNFNEEELLEMNNTYIKNNLDASNNLEGFDLIEKLTNATNTYTNDYNVIKKLVDKYLTLVIKWDKDIMLLCCTSSDNENMIKASLYNKYDITSEGLWTGLIPTIIANKYDDLLNKIIEKEVLPNYHNNKERFHWIIKYLENNGYKLD